VAPGVLPGVGAGKSCRERSPAGWRHPAIPPPGGQGVAAGAVIAGRALQCTAVPPLAGTVPLPGGMPSIGTML